MAKEQHGGDLRWRRTERHLMEALASQLVHTPLERVKVTELVREAEVSKATFYLHYRDVFDLADAFVASRATAVADELGDPLLPMRDPRAFVHRFVGIFGSEEHRRFIDMAARNHLAPLFMEQLWSTLGQRVEAAAPLDVRTNPGLPAPGAYVGRIALAYTIGGMINAVQSNGDVAPEVLGDALAHLLACTLADVANGAEK